jgi:hypothetical protein
MVMVARSQTAQDTLAEIPPEARFGARMRAKWQQEPHSTLRATVYSAVVPGLGQLYNKKYWKAPIAWVGEGICLFFIIDNTRQYRYYRSEYVKIVTGQPSALSGFNPVDVFNAMDQVQRWRDLSVFSLIGVHLLQIIDANVDAHLTYFDVSDDLSLLVHPSVILSTHTTPAIGFTLRF